MDSLITHQCLPGSCGGKGPMGQRGFCPGRTHNITEWVMLRNYTQIECEELWRPLCPNGCALYESAGANHSIAFSFPCSVGKSVPQDCFFSALTFGTWPGNALQVRPVVAGSPQIECEELWRPLCPNGCALYESAGANHSIAFSFPCSVGKSVPQDCFFSALTFGTWPGNALQVRPVVAGSPWIPLN